MKHSNGFTISIYFLKLTHTYILHLNQKNIAQFLNILIKLKNKKNDIKYFFKKSVMV